MISRIVMRTLFVAATLGAPLAGVTPAAADSWIKGAAILGNYDPEDAEYSADRGRHLPAVIIGTRRLAPEVMARAVAVGMRGYSGPGLSQAEAAAAPLRVVWEFDDGWWTAKDSCKRRDTAPSAVIPAVVRGYLRVVATFCRGDDAITQVVGFTDLHGSTKDLKFIDFIRHMTSGLFPSPKAGLRGNDGPGRRDRN